MKQTLITFIFLSFSSFLNSQETFFKLFKHEKSTAITGLHSTDSAYYMAINYNISMYPSEKKFGYGKFDLQGSLLSLDETGTGENKELHTYNPSSFDTNFRGNLMHCYLFIDSDTVNGLTRGAAKLIEWSTSQGYINEFEIDFRQDSIQINRFSSVIPSSIDSSYYCLLGFSDLINNVKGVKLLKLSKTGNIIWNKVISDSPWINVYARSFIQKSDSTFLIGVAKTDWNQNSESESFGKAQFFNVNLDGQVKDSWFFEEDEYIELGNGLVPLENDEFVFSYLSSINEIVDSTYGDDFAHIPMLTKLNTDLDTLWRVKLHPKHSINPSLLGVPKKLISDGNQIIGAHQWWDYWYEIPNDIQSYRSVGGLKIFSRDPNNGKELWSRTYDLWSFLEGDSGEIDTLHDQSTEYYIHDLNKTSDDGYIINGRTVNYDSVVDNYLINFGFILKVNCLGFIDSPNAGVEFQHYDDLKVIFHNTSTQAGYYEWIFGDGTTTTSTTSEEDNYIEHTYPTIKEYEGMMIAHGCNGEADTVFFTATPVKDLDPTTVTEGNGYFTIFPNPVVSGEQVFIYITSLEGSTTLEIHDSMGKLVDRINIKQSESAYHILPSPASGEYYLTLYSEDEKKATHKLIVTN